MKIVKHINIILKKGKKNILITILNVTMFLQFHIGFHFLLHLQVKN